MMINPDNYDSRARETDKTQKPVGPVHKDRAKNHEVREHFKTKEELEEEWRLAKDQSAKGKKPVGKSLFSLDQKGEEPRAVSLFDLAKKDSRSKEGDSSPDSNSEISSVDVETDTLAEELTKTAEDLKPEKLATRSSFNKVDRPVANNTKSLFDLASHTQDKVEELPVKPISSMEEPTLPIADLSNFGVREALSVQKPIEASIQTPEPPLTPAQNASVRIQKIIDEIVEHIYQVEKSGETSTTITLNQDGVFKGVSIKISEFDSAKGQLNITIDNLTGEAKQLIDLHENQLFKTLERQGYQVQQFIATTAIENPRFDDQKAGEERSQREGSQKDGSNTKEQRNRDKKDS